MTSGFKTGMPILYYRARKSGSVNPNQINSFLADVASRIYEFEDNDDFIDHSNVPIPWDPTNNGGNGHPLYSGYNTTNGNSGALENFYWQINNDSISINNGRPVNSDSYILISAGFDGLYGTRDDIFNF